MPGWQSSYHVVNFSLLGVSVSEKLIGYGSAYDLQPLRRNCRSLTLFNDETIIILPCLAASLCFYIFFHFSDQIYSLGQSISTDKKKKKKKGRLRTWGKDLGPCSVTENLLLNEILGGRTRTCREVERLSKFEESQYLCCCHIEAVESFSPSFSPEAFLSETCIYFSWSQ